MRDLRSTPLHSLHRHCECAVVCLVAADEAVRVHEDAARYAAQLVERRVANSTPWFRQRLAVVEAARRCRNALHTPPSRRVLVQHVKRFGILRESRLILERVQMVFPWTELTQNGNLAARVHIRSTSERILDDRASRKPSICSVRNGGVELRANKLHCCLETLVDTSGIHRFIPARIQLTHPAAHGRRVCVPWRVSAVEWHDAVVDGIDGHDERLVDMEVHRVDVRVTRRTSESRSNDISSKLFIHKSCTAQLDGVP
mmetsp:Transcript_16243/g.41395  ORF Transcript_16243/g.41395 Transcript_16243/m.41395 type:complete len:257 (+) Transcript_16243:25-795(+)